MTNIQAGQSWSMANSAISSEISEICSNFAWTGSILNLRLHPQNYVSWLKDALACARQIENQEAEGAHLGNLGLAYAALGDAKKAIEHYQQALDIAREIGDRRGEGADLGNLGNAYADLGDAKKAIGYYEQHLDIAREIGDRRGEAKASWNLGIEYEKSGDFKRAADLMQVCVDFEHEIGHPDAGKDADRLENVRAKSRKM
jgi:tetratricopeptide (TPR) repeat protein